MLQVSAHKGDVLFTTEENAPKPTNKWTGINKAVLTNPAESQTKKHAWESELSLFPNLLNLYGITAP